MGPQGLWMSPSEKLKNKGLNRIYNQHYTNASVCNPMTSMKYWLLLTLLLLMWIFLGGRLYLWGRRSPRRRHASAGRQGFWKREPWALTEWDFRWLPAREFRQESILEGKKWIIMEIIKPSLSFLEKGRWEHYNNNKKTASNALFSQSIQKK